MTNDLLSKEQKSSAEYPRWEYGIEKQPTIHASKCWVTRYILHGENGPKTNFDTNPLTYIGEEGERFAAAIIQALKSGYIKWENA